MLFLSDVFILSKCHFSPCWSRTCFSVDKDSDHLHLLLHKVFSFCFGLDPNILHHNTLITDMEPFSFHSKIMRGVLEIVPETEPEFRRSTILIIMSWLFSYLLFPMMPHKEVVSEMFSNRPQVFLHSTHCQLTKQKLPEQWPNHLDIPEQFKGIITIVSVNEILSLIIQTFYKGKKCLWILTHLKQKSLTSFSVTQGETVMCVFTWCI